jgi:hypothetical protein
MIIVGTLEKKNYKSLVFDENHPSIKTHSWLIFYFILKLKHFPLSKKKKLKHFLEITFFYKKWETKTITSGFSKACVNITTKVELIFFKLVGF